MIALQSVKAYTPLNIFFRKAPQDDLVIKIAKVAYRTLEYLFQLIEMGMEYLMHDPRPKPFHVRYKWSVRITVIALSAIGMYYGTQYIKDKIFRYFNSFIPDFSFLTESQKKIADYIKGFLYEKETPAEKPSEDHDSIFTPEQVEKLKQIFEKPSEGLTEETEPNVSPPDMDEDLLSDMRSNYPFAMFFEDAKNLSFKVADVVGQGRKMIKGGIYNLSYYAMDKSGLEKPEWFLNPLGNVLSLAMFALGSSKLLGHFPAKKKMKAVRDEPSPTYNKDKQTSQDRKQEDKLNGLALGKFQAPDGHGSASSDDGVLPHPPSQEGEPDHL